MSQLHQHEWHYMCLEMYVIPRMPDYTNIRTLESLFAEEHPTLFNNIEIDDLTWRAIIQTSLRSFHGLRGESSPFDLLQRKVTEPRNQMIIRIQPEDVDVFITSLMNYAFNASNYLGSDYNSGAYLRVVKHAQFLGVLQSNEFRE